MNDFLQATIGEQSTRLLGMGDAGWLLISVISAIAAIVFSPPLKRAPPWLNGIKGIVCVLVFIQCFLSLLIILR